MLLSQAAILAAAPQLEPCACAKSTTSVHSRRGSDQHSRRHSSPCECGSEGERCRSARSVQRRGGGGSQTSQNSEQEQVHCRPALSQNFYVEQKEDHSQWDIDFEEFKVHHKEEAPQIRMVSSQQEFDDQFSISLDIEINQRPEWEVRYDQIFCKDVDDYRALATIVDIEVDCRKRQIRAVEPMQQTLFLMRVLLILQSQYSPVKIPLIQRLKQSLSQSSLHYERKVEMKACLQLLRFCNNYQKINKIIICYEPCCELLLLLVDHLCKPIQSPQLQFKQKVTAVLIAFDLECSISNNKYLFCYKDAQLFEIDFDLLIADVCFDFSRVELSNHSASFINNLIHNAAHSVLSQPCPPTRKRERREELDMQRAKRNTARLQGLRDSLKTGQFNK